MYEHSFIGKILCAVVAAAMLGFGVSEALGTLLINSAASETQIYWVKCISGCSGALIGALLGWANSGIILSGALYTTVASIIIGWF